LVSVTASGASACSQSITGTAVVSVTPELTFEIDSLCQNNMLQLQVIEESFNIDAVTFAWSQGTTPVGTDAATFNVDEYLAQNPSVTLPVTFTLTVTVNGCSAQRFYTVENNPCRLIPRGISPNNDQLNDTFDLTGFGVKEIIIFNRYGVKVFSYSGNYTDQWRGQSDSGNDLPDGTYFYSIHTVEGAEKTGWVYINRQY
jgi:gliding motility-associated-like protein